MRIRRLIIGGLSLLALSVSMTTALMTTAAEQQPATKAAPKAAPKKEAPAKPAAEEAVPAEAEPADDAGGELKTVEERFSYGIGLNIGRDFASNGVNANPELIARGIADVMKGNKPLLTEEQIGAAMQAMTKVVQEQRVARGEKNLKAGEEFLAANAKRKGVTTTKSGLQYEVMKAGTGKVSPKVTDTISAHYHGTLIDGKVFDSSVERGEPLEIPVGGVIAGWTEALQLMKAGDKWKIFLPSKLAYGPDGSPPKIEPNSALVFEIELIEIK